MGNRGIYKYSENFRRMGGLSGIFTADADDVALAMGEDAYLGEVLGKHSEVTASITPETVKLVSDNPEFVALFDKHEMSTGTDPVNAWLNREE
jgi:hypothetical protein